MEAALRYAVEKIQGEKLEAFEFQEVRGNRPGDKAIREAQFNVKGTTVKVCVVYGLANAKIVADWVRKGEKQYDFIEVMACPMGCVGGAGQPVTNDWEVRRARAEGLYKADKTLQLHKPQDNHVLRECYDQYFEGGVGGHTAHQLLHTTYHNRRRIDGMNIAVLDDAGTTPEVKVAVCVGTSCYVRGSQAVLKKIADHVQEKSLGHLVKIEATFCTENCDRGPMVMVGDKMIYKATAEQAIAEITQQLEAVKTRV
jgi:NADH-quinone oxidoreductase subunit G